MDPAIRAENNRLVREELKRMALEELRGAGHDAGEALQRVG